MMAEATSTGPLTARAPTAAVHVPPSSIRGDLRAVKIVWQREMIRFTKDRLRIVTQLVQPILFLFVLGTGLSRLASAGTHGVDLRTFVYPGVLCMAVLFTAMFSAASLVWDREFGFLREMMVAPVRRSSIVIGKVLGGATVASFQGVIVICLAGFVGVPYKPLMIIGIFTHFFALETTLAERQFFRALAKLVGRRAARLSACGIAAIVSKMGYLESGCSVGADGSLYNVRPYCIACS